MRQNTLGEKAAGVQSGALDLENLSQDQKASVIQLTQTALDVNNPGSKQATELLTKLGVMKPTEEGIDSFVKASRMMNPDKPQAVADAMAGSLYLRGKMGTDQVQLAKMKMAESLMKNFDNDLQKSAAYVEGVFEGKPTGLQPQMSIEDFKTYTDAKKVLLDAHPTAPSNLVDAVAHAQMTGNKSIVDGLMKTLNTYPRAGTLDMQKHQQTLGYDYANLAERTQNDINTLNLGIATELGKSNNAAFDNWKSIFFDKNASEEQKAAATRGMADSLSKDSKIKINYRGQEISLGSGDVEAISNWRPWPMSNKNYIQPRQAPDDLINQFLKPSDVTADKTSAIREFAQKAIQMPDGKQKLEALGDLARALQQVPKPLRSTLVQQLNLPNDMKPAAQQLVNDLPASIQIGSGVLRLNQ